MATQVIPPEVKNNEPERDAATGKFVYRFQPRDKEGQFIGKEYKFLYNDYPDLVRQITDAKIEADKYVHEVKTGKRQVVGEPATPRPEFKPAAESAEETEKKARESFRATAEKELGAPLEDVRTALKKATALDEYLLAQNWAMQNEANGYYICQQNAKAMMAYLTENKLKLSHSNLDLAFDALKDTLVPKPQEQPIRAEEQPPIKAKPQSTGIIPGQFNSTRLPNRTEKQPLTAERFRQINRMSRDEFNRLKRTNKPEYDAFILMKTPAQPQQ